MCALYGGGRASVALEDAAADGGAEGGGDGVALFVVRMHGGENRFDGELNGELNACLDGVEEAVRTRLPPSRRVALVLTGEAKYFSVGLDLQSYYVAGGTAAQEVLRQTYLRLIARLLVFPMATVAAVNGHAIAGGMVAALACDYRVMVRGRGFMAMNEIQLPSSIPAGMLALVQHRIASPQTQRECVLLGRRFTGEEMHAAGVVDALASEDASLMAAARALAAKAAHPASRMPFVGLIKRVQHREPHRRLVEAEEVDHFALAAASKI